MYMCVCVCVCVYIYIYLTCKQLLKKKLFLREHVELNDQLSWSLAACTVLFLFLLFFAALPQPTIITRFKKV